MSRIRVVEKPIDRWGSPAARTRFSTATDGWIDALSLTVLADEVMRALNLQVDVDERNPSAVAVEWLVEKGISTDGATM